MDNEAIANGWEDYAPDTQSDNVKYEVDQLGFFLNDKTFADIPKDEIFAKYRNVYDVEDDKILMEKIWVKRAKVNIIIRNFPSVIHKIKTLISKLATKFELDLHDMWLELVISGLFSKLREMNQLGQLQEMDEDFIREVGALLEYEKIAKEKNIVNTLTPMYESKTTDEFEQWCKEWRWDYEKFYQLRNEEMMKLSFSKRSKMWIHKEVKELNNPMPVEDFIKNAMNAGILEESQYNAFYQHIGRLGYLNKPYGYVFDD